jgi:glycosyltransferase involved in cell wall biosynthesis
VTPPPARKVLFVAHGAPPSPLPGARRIAGLTRYLSELGYEVTVLTSVVFGRGPERFGAARLVRTRDAIASPVLEQRRRLRGQAAVAPEPDPAAGAGQVADGNREIRRSRLASYLTPDTSVLTWLPFALPRAFELEARHRFDCVITSIPPRSTHLIGLALHGRGLPWVADFRDGWNFEVVRPELAPVAAWLDRRLEELVASRADVATAVTDSITDDLVARLGSRAATVTNGFDPAEVLDGAPGTSDLLAPERHSLVYTGSLYPTRFAPFARALAEVERDRPDLASRMEIVIVGPSWEGVRELAEAERLSMVRWHRPRPRGEILRLQRQADSLLMLVEPERPGMATTKLYEYLAAERPVLAVGPEGEASRILAETGGGFSCPASADGLAAALDRLLEGEAPSGDASKRDAYTYPRLAEQMAEQVEAAIAARRA